MARCATFAAVLAVLAVCASCQLNATNKPRSVTELTRGTPAGASVDALTEAYCFRSAEECQNSRGVPCGLADGDSCRESSARTCAQAGAGFTWYCPVTASLDDPSSGQTCYRRQSECERTSGNDCETSGTKRCTTAGATCSGVQGSGFAWSCPSVAQTGQQQQAGGTTNMGG